MVCRVSRIHPKPGYSGHLWQIANLVKARFPSPLLTLAGKRRPAAFFPIHFCLFSSPVGLAEETLAQWQTFVQRDLAAINEAQVVTRVSGPPPHNRLIFLLPSCLAGQQEL